jgi:hypothetical protein
MVEAERQPVKRNNTHFWRVPRLIPPQPAANDFFLWRHRESIKLIPPLQPISDFLKVKPRKLRLFRRAAASAGLRQVRFVVGYLMAVWVNAAVALCLRFPAVFFKGLGLSNDFIRLDGAASSGWGTRHSPNSEKA